MVLICETVFEAMDEAVKRARKGDGPTLLEMNTYRYEGHSMSDPAKYRTKDELNDFKSKDPIESVLQVIVKNKYASEAEIEAINQKIKDIVEDSVQFAEESPYPEAHELYEDVYVQNDYPYILD